MALTTGVWAAGESTPWRCPGGDRSAECGTWTTPTATLVANRWQFSDADRPVVVGGEVQWSDADVALLLPKEARVEAKEPGGVRLARNTTAEERATARSQALEARERARADAKVNRKLRRLRAAPLGAAAAPLTAALLMGYSTEPIVMPETDLFPDHLIEMFPGPSYATAGRARRHRLRAVPLACFTDSCPSNSVKWISVFTEDGRTFLNKDHQVVVELGEGERVTGFSPEFAFPGLLTRAAAGKLIKGGIWDPSVERPVYDEDGSIIGYQDLVGADGIQLAPKSRPNSKLRPMLPYQRDAHDRHTPDVIVMDDRVEVFFGPYQMVFPKGTTTLQATNAARLVAASDDPETAYWEQYKRIVAELATPEDINLGFMLAGGNRWAKEGAAWSNEVDGVAPDQKEAAAVGTIRSQQGAERTVLIELDASRVVLVNGDGTEANSWPLQRRDGALAIVLSPETRLPVDQSDMSRDPVANVLINWLRSDDPLVDRLHSYFPNGLDVWAGDRSRYRASAPVETAKVAAALGVSAEEAASIVYEANSAFEALGARPTGELDGFMLQRIRDRMRPGLESDSRWARIMHPLLLANAGISRNPDGIRLFGFSAGMKKESADMFQALVLTRLEEKLIAMNATGDDQRVTLWDVYRVTRDALKDVGVPDRTAGVLTELSVLQLQHHFGLSRDAEVDSTWLKIVREAPDSAARRDALRVKFDRGKFRAGDPRGTTRGDHQEQQVLSPAVTVNTVPDVTPVARTLQPFEPADEADIVRIMQAVEGDGLTRDKVEAALYDARRKFERLVGIGDPMAEGWHEIEGYRVGLYSSNKLNPHEFLDGYRREHFMPTGIMNRLMTPGATDMPQDRRDLAGRLLSIVVHRDQEEAAVQARFAAHSAIRNGRPITLAEGYAGFYQGLRAMGLSPVAALEITEMGYLRLRSWNVPMDVQFWPMPA